MAVLILLMMAATVLEKRLGTPAAFRWVYHNPAFIALWGVVAASGIAWLLARRVQRHFATLLLHLSFAVILAGALTTYLTGEKGRVHLRTGEPVATFETEDGRVRELPFSLTLERFSVEYYTGSQAAADYRSEVSVLPGTPLSISMNHIGKAAGYRFYQADYDEDLQGSTLSVTHDPWGIGITYTGYLLLLLSMFGFFFQKGSRFRTVLRQVIQASAFVLALVLPTGLRAQESRPEALPRPVADAFGDLYVYYNDRICPLETLARDYCLKAYGKARWHGYDAVQVVTGWLFYYDSWQGVPFKVKARDRGTAKESEKEFIQRSVASGDALRLYPVADGDGTVAWFSADEPLPAHVYDDYDRWVFIRKVMDVVETAVRAEDWDEVVRIVGKIKAYQEKTAASVLPSPSKIRAERAYNRLSRPMVPFMASLTLGLVLFVLMGIGLSRGRRAPRQLLPVLAAVTALLWLYLTLALGLRWYVSGHAPFAGSYNVMMLMAWLTTVAMLLLYRRFPMVQPLGFILAGFTMLMASLSSANPQITHLMPVLQSPLLSLHVLSMMISYTLFGLVALNGGMGLAVRSSAATLMLREVSLVILYPAVFLLTFGTFLGAVWANISWGSYWAWDPKETWALITLLVYAAALHGGSLQAFRRPRFFHAYTLCAFLTVLVTYFGVNLLLGGLHAYA